MKNVKLVKSAAITAITAAILSLSTSATANSETKPITAEKFDESIMRDNWLHYRGSVGNSGIDEDEFNALITRVTDLY